MWKSMFSIAVVLMLGLANCVLAADINWIGDPCDPGFCNPLAWEGGVVPGFGDTAFINPPPSQGPVVNCNADVHNIFGPRFDSDDDQVMDIVSGNLSVGSWLIGNAGTGTSTINISGDPVINISGVRIDADTIAGIEAGNGEGTMILNITDTAKITSGGRWKLATHGKAIVNISGNPDIVINDQWRNSDAKDGYFELHMSGGSLYVARYLCIYDDGSGLMDFSGGTIQFCGLSFAGRPPSSRGEINVRGTADVSVAYEVRLSYEGPGRSTLNISDSGSLHTHWLKMGESTAVCTLNMTGGLLDASRDITAPSGELATANINLHGGTINCRKFIHAGDNWHMDICGGGTMILDGDVKAEIEGYVADGHIAACLGAQGHFVCVNYDTINPGKTTVQERFCAGDMDGNCQRTLADLDALVNVLLGAGPPFIAPCCE